MANSNILFKNFALLDVESGTLKGGYQVLVRDGRFAAVEHGAINADGALEIDLGGRTLMPGLIDCHVHIHPLILPTTPQMLPSLITAHALSTLEGMPLCVMQVVPMRDIARWWNTVFSRTASVCRRSCDQSDRRARRPAHFRQSIRALRMRGASLGLRAWSDRRWCRRSA